MATQRTDEKARERKAQSKGSDRERMHREAEAGQEALTEHERDRVREHSGLSSLTVYSIVRREGEEELRRPMSSLWWSGVAAGVGISSSVLAEALLHHELDGHRLQVLLENFGYSVGFVLVIMSRLQLFTENTITVILPMLAEPTRGKFWCIAKLWTVVFLANMVGTFFTAFITLYLGTTNAEHTEAMLSISRHFAESQGIDALLLGIPAGFFIASIVWMLPSARGSSVLIIILFTYLIALGEFTHVIAGSTEVFLLVLNGELGLTAAAFGLILPTLVGNIIGGTGLFAVLAYAQVREEM